MRLLVGLMMLALPAVVLAHDDPAPSKPLPGASESRKAILAIENGGHLGMIFDVFFTHDGKQIISVGLDKTVQIWDAVTGERVKVLRLPKQSSHPLSIFRSALAPDSKTLAIGGYEAQPGKRIDFALLLHLETGKVMPLPDLKFDSVKSLCFSGDGDRLAIGGQVTEERTSRAAVWVWSGLKDAWKNPLAGPIELTMPRGKIDNFSSLQSIVFAGKANQVAALVHRQPFIRMIYTWDLAKADGTVGEVNLKRSPRWFVLTPDGRRVVAEDRLSGSLEQKVNVWSSDGKLLKTASVKDFPRPPGAPGGTLVAASPVFRSNHELLLTQALVMPGPPVTWSAAIVRWDLDGGKIDEIQRFPPPPNVPAVMLRAFSPDNKRAVFFSGHGFGQHEMAVVNVERPHAVVQISRDRSMPRYAWSRQGYQIAWTGEVKEKLVSAVDLETLQQLPAVDPLVFARPNDPNEPTPKSADRKYLAAEGSGLSEIADIVNKNFQPLFSVYTAGQDWVIWTPEGYYAASPGGEKLVGWHVNNGADKPATFYPVERFRKQLYRPDVIKLVLKKGSVKEALKAADAARGKETRDVNVDDLLPPRTVLTVLDQSKLPIVKLKVQAEASGKAQPITSLRLMMDGRIVPGKEMLVEYPAGKSKAEVEWTFELPEGEHQWAVLARCPDSSSVSQSVRLKSVSPAKLPVLHVLTVGINQYKDPALDLKYAAPDADALANAFVKNCKGQPFSDVKTRKLLNRDATAKNIVKELLAVRRSVAQQDLVVVFFACHGVKQKNSYYLLTHEADVLNPLDQTSLSGDALRQALAGYKCQVLLMLDACHAAGFGAGGKLSKLGLKPATDDVARDLTEDEYGVAVMCAAMSNEKAEGQAGHGLFTQAILDALAKKPGVPFNQRNRRLYVHHLQSYVFDEVSGRSEERQHPFLSLPWVVESFVVR